MDYAEQIQAQSNNISWAEQLEMGEQPNPSQINIPLEQNVLSNPVYMPQGSNNNIMLSPPNLKPSVILYQADQPADSCLWNSNFAPISLFGTDEFLNDDAKNIMCSL